MECQRYQIYSKLWKHTGIDWNPIGTYKCGSVEITVEDCDGDMAYLTIKRRDEYIVDQKLFRDEDKAYEEAEDYLVSIGFLVRDEVYQKMRFPKLSRNQYLEKQRHETNRKAFNELRLTYNDE